MRAKHATRPSKWKSARDFQVGSWRREGSDFGDADGVLFIRVDASYRELPQGGPEALADAR